MSPSCRSPVVSVPDGSKHQDGAAVDDGLCSVPLVTTKMPPALSSAVRSRSPGPRRRRIPQARAPPGPGVPLGPADRRRRRPHHDRRPAAAGRVGAAARSTLPAASYSRAPPPPTRSPPSASTTRRTSHGTWKSTRPPPRASTPAVIRGRPGRACRPPPRPRTSQTRRNGFAGCSSTVRACPTIPAGSLCVFVSSQNALGGEQGTWRGSGSASTRLSSLRIPASPAPTAAPHPPEAKKPNPQALR